MKNKSKNKYDMSKRSSYKPVISIEDLEKRAEKNFENEKYEEALVDFLKIFEIRGSYLDLINLGQCYYFIEDYKKTIEIFSELYNSPFKGETKEDEESFNDLRKVSFDFIASSYLELNEFEDCIKFCEKVKSTEFHYLSALQNLIRAYGATENEEKMNEYYENIIKISPNNKDANHFLANYWFENSNNEKALEYFSKINFDELEPEDIYEIIDIVHGETNYEIIIKYCELYLQKINLNDEKNNTSEFIDKLLIVYEDLLYSYFQLKNYENAIKYFRLLHFIYDNENIEYESLYLFKYIALSYINLNNFDEPIAVINDMIEKGYDDSNLTFSLGMLYYFKNDYEKSIESFEKTLNYNDSDDIFIKIILGVMKYLKSSNFTEGKEYFVSLLSQFDKEEYEDAFLVINFIIAIISNKLGNKEEYEKYNEIVKNMQNEEYIEVLTVEPDEEFCEKTILMSIESFHF